MAETVKDFTNNDSLYEQVLWQRGRVVIDGELSEIGRLGRLSRYRNEIIHQSTDESKPPAAETHAVPIIKRVTFFLSPSSGVGDDQVKMSPSGAGMSLISAWGYVWEFKADVFFETAPNNTGANTFQELYMVIEETEETVGTAPAIKVDDLGETARRVKLKITYKVGDLNESAAVGEYSALRPWDKGGKQSFIIGTIRRAQGGGPTARNELQLHYRLPEEIKRAELSMMNGKFRLRSSSKKGGAVATARISNTNEVTIRNLQVLIGMSYVANDVDSFLGVHVDGEFTIRAGESLVAVIPVKPNPAQGTQNVEDSDYNGKESAVGPGDIQLLVMPMWHFNTELTTPAGFREACLDNLFVICTRVSDEDAHSTVATLDRDYVFADGQRLTRQAFNPIGPDHDVTYPKAHYLTWGYGNKWIDRLEPDDKSGKPTSDTDQTPWERRWMPPRKYSLKLIYSDILRDVEEDPSNPSGGAGALVIMSRQYKSYRLPINVSGDSYEFTGDIRTINARYVPSADPVEGGHWHADDVEQESLIEYLGFSESLAGPSNIIVKMHAFREAGATSPWVVDEWDNGFDVDGAHHRISRLGSMNCTAAQTTARATLSNFKRFTYGTHSLPVRDSGVTPAIDKAQHAANTRPLAYGLVKCDQSTMTLLDGAFNFESVILIDPGGSPDFNRSYLVMTYPGGGVGPDSDIIVPHVQMVKRGSDFTNFQDFRTGISVEIQGGGILHIYISSEVFGVGHAQEHRILGLTNFHLAVTVFGGYDPT